MQKKPGTLDLTSNTNALMIVTDLLDQIDPVQTYDDMVDFTQVNLVKFIMQISAILKENQCLSN